MSRDWLEDSEEFADRMMTHVLKSARLLDNGGVEIEMSEEMVWRAMKEMGVCPICGERDCAHTPEDVAEAWRDRPTPPAQQPEPAEPTP